jgi:bifunctional UDP-N-acetylglucosamine pyrophosphorylase/glucosamine-1-phosphate N-acetyltransferase
VIRAIVLAAGKGTRMKSARSKVLHEVCGRPMLWYVVQALRGAGIGEIVVVISPELRDEIERFDVESVVQEEQLGTGHAVRVALEHLDPRSGRLVVVCGDMPLVTGELLGGMAGSLDADGGVAPVMALVTVKMNAGIYAFDEVALRDAVARLRPDNAQGEYYLTDTVAEFVRDGRGVRPMLAPDHLHVLGINDRVELAQARKEMNARLCAAHMREGVTIVDPETTYLEPELEIGGDTVLYPNTTIARLSSIGRNCVVGPNSRLSNAKLGDRVTVRESVITDTTIGDDVRIGPFAHLRGETRLGDKVHVGNFVEIKKSNLARRVKVSHLSYLGDATIGEETNVGAGTITCNFDGERKHPTIVGRGVAIGSNTSLVAPVRVGDGALTGAGSVVTKDVPSGERVAGNPARPLPKK